MKKRFLIGVVVVRLIGEDTLLSPLKEEYFQLQTQEKQLQSKKLKDSWIRPLNISYLYQKGDQFPNQQLESFVIGVDQPIFKSGGIFKAIRYAKKEGSQELLGVKISKKELVAKLLELLYTYHKTKLQIQKQNYLIQNARINLAIKQEQYLSNQLDSTFLDNAILEKNQKELALLNLKDNLVTLTQQIQELSDVEIDSFKLPNFYLLPKKEFLGKNLPLKRSLKKIEASKEFKALTLTKYLPQISLKANYYYQKMQGSLYIPNYSYSDHYTTYGIGVKVPLFDINFPKEVELAKIKVLKAKNSYLQTRREMEKRYLATFQKLKVLGKKIKLAKEDFKLYNKLYQATLEQFEAGEKTEFDLETMRNSLKIKALDEKIYKLEKQILLLNLYKSVDDGTF